MIVIIFALILVYLVHIYSDAAWDAAAFKKGESNHLYKYIRLTAFLISSLLISIISENLKVGILLVLIYPCLRITFFDDILNFLRQKPSDYKAFPWWAKWISAIIGIIGLPLLIFYV